MPGAALGEGRKWSPSNAAGSTVAPAATATLGWHGVAVAKAKAAEIVTVPPLLLAAMIQLQRPIGGQPVPVLCTSDAN